MRACFEPAGTNHVAALANTVCRLNETGSEAFKAQLYWSMISQALVIKQNIEKTRSINRFGIMVWQLNEICALCPVFALSYYD